MRVSRKIQLLLTGALTIFSPLVAAHGLDGHSDAFITVIRHVLVEHGYWLLMLVAVLCVHLLRGYDRL